jgi:hypothetical protein
MIRTLFTFLVLACVMGLSGMLTGRLWERYLDETGSLGFTGIYERLLAPKPALQMTLTPPRALA